MMVLLPSDEQLQFHETWRTQTNETNPMSLYNLLLATGSSEANDDENVSEDSGTETQTDDVLTVDLVLSKL